MGIAGPRAQRVICLGADLFRGMLGRRSSGNRNREHAGLREHRHRQKWESRRRQHPDRPLRLPGLQTGVQEIGGPFSLEGSTIFGHLNKDSTAFAAGDNQFGQVDIYKYAPKNVTYLYSFNSGLSVSGDVGGVA